MGNKFLRVVHDENQLGTRYSGSAKSGNDIIKLQIMLKDKFQIPLEIQVAHFTPSNFPLMPFVNPKSVSLCSDSWGKIVNNNQLDNSGTSISGLTVFYNDFYDRLRLADSTGKFEAILARHTSGSNAIAAKGAILLRIIQYALKIDSDTPHIQMMLYMLGKSHAQKHIRPWQYAVFIQTLLYTISSQLGTEATNEVMEAWVNLFAFILKSMLPVAIKDQVVETELNINTSSVFDQATLLHEVRRTPKKLKRIIINNYA